MADPQPVKPVEDHIQPELELFLVVTPAVWPWPSPR
jgi:hypothetical protein